MKMSIAPDKDEKTPDMAFTKAWIKDVEIAFIKGTSLWCNDAADLDRMIDDALSASGKEAVLESRKAFGAGCHYYLDYDVIGLMKSAVSALPGEQAAAPMAFFGKVTSTAPIVFAVTFADARARIQAKIPLEPFVQLKNAAR